jgi:hypothetical protein
MHVDVWEIPEKPSAHDREKKPCLYVESFASFSQSCGEGEFKGLTKMTCLQLAFLPQTGHSEHAEFCDAHRDAFNFPAPAPI